MRLWDWAVAAYAAPDVAARRARFGNGRHAQGVDIGSPLVRLQRSAHRARQRALGRFVDDGDLAHRLGRADQEGNAPAQHRE